MEFKLVEEWNSLLKLHNFIITQKSKDNKTKLDQDKKGLYNLFLKTVQLKINIKLGTIRAKTYLHFVHFKVVRMG